MSEPGAAAVVQCRGLAKTYYPGAGVAAVPVLLDVSLEVAAGEMVVTEGTQRLAPGMQVSIIPSAKPAAEAPGKKGG